MKDGKEALGDFKLLFLCHQIFNKLSENNSNFR